MTDNKNEIKEEKLESVTGGTAAEETINSTPHVALHNMPKINPDEKYVMKIEE